MTREGLYKLLHKLGISIVRDDGEWVNLSCPLAYKYHLSKRDEHPSCGISYDNDGKKRSIVNCFTCGSRDLLSLLTILFYDKKIDYDILQFYIENEMGSDVYSIKLEYPDVYKEDDICYRPTTKPIPRIVLDSLMPGYKSLELQKYFKRRRINLKYLHNVYSWRNGVVFPFKDLDGNVYKLHYRVRNERNKKLRFYFLEAKDFGIKEEWGTCKHLWYNIENIDWSKPVFLVEGEFDVLRLQTLGCYNVIACCGGLSREQIKYLEYLSPVWLYIGFDADFTGRKYTTKIKDVFNNISVLNWGLAGIKDAGDLKDRKSLEKVIKKAK